MMVSSLSGFPLAVDAARTLAVSRGLASVVVAGGSVVLLYYVVAYVRHVLAEPDGRRWWYLGLGIAAGAVYGVAGFVNALAPSPAVAAFARGATLFFILFLALGIRAMYVYGLSHDRPRGLPEWVDYVVVAGFVGSWWLTFLVESQWLWLPVSVGWGLASVWALYYSLLTVRHHEGTTLAAVTRHLFPVIVSVAVVVAVDIVGQYRPAVQPFADAFWLVGTVLVGAFLFTTAVAIRQQGGEVQRMYDWTTWREQRLTGED